MTTLGIRYLTGRSVASNISRPREPEWPPHPGRVFMAMASTCFETGGDEHERKALEWLEQADAPVVRASDGEPRSFVETYVPVNDKLGKDSGVALRARQPRSFPTIRPAHDCVYLIWNAEMPQHLSGALERLCSRVTRIGHSSSLVQMWLADNAERLGREWLPDGSAFGHQMRVAEPGTLAYLQKAFNKEAIEHYHGLVAALGDSEGKEKNKLKKEIGNQFPGGEPIVTRPRLTCWQGYASVGRRESEEEVRNGPFDPNLIVLTRKDEQRILGLETTLQLTSALRDAAMKAGGKDIPEWLTGHQPDGSPTLKPHVAFLPLPFVGAKHADGHVMGLAMAIPRKLDKEGGETRSAALRGVIGPLLFHDTGEEKTIRLWRHHAWTWELEREKREYPPVSLRAKTWTGPARKWASVTPVVLHHYPKPKREGEVQRILFQAFESAGLPTPARMGVQLVSFFEGAGHIRSMPEFTDGGENLCRYQIHVVVEFPFLVQGPVLVGRGRYRGYGLLRPVEVHLG